MARCFFTITTGTTFTAACSAAGGTDAEGLSRTLLHHTGESLEAALLTARALLSRASIPKLTVAAGGGSDHGPGASTGSSVLQQPGLSDKLGRTCLAGLPTTRYTTSKIGNVNISSQCTHSFSRGPRS